MTVILKGTERDVVTIRWIPKYTLMERLGHWLHTATFVPLAITGLILYTPLLQSLAQGEAGHLVRLIHRAAAILFGLLPIIYLIVQPRRFIMSIREFMFERDDIEWVKNAVSYYLLGRHTAMPPQGRFNTGEKMNGLIMCVSWAVLGITGLVMWFGKGAVAVGSLSIGFAAPSWLFTWSVLIHDLAMIVAVCMFLVHLWLAVGHPLMWAGLVSMRFGVTSASYAAEHHAKWFYGPKRARQLYEEAQSKAASEASH
jgi:formate dehydrogenase subunit gamma